MYSFDITAHLNLLMFFSTLRLARKKKRMVETIRLL